MQINFFEEYPTVENMAKIDLVDWPSTVLVAAKSLDEFEKIRSKYEFKHPHITLGWWPTIPGSYWVSGVSNPKDLNRLFGELLSKKYNKEFPVLIDMELPLKKNFRIKNIFNIGINKRKIDEFFEKASSYNLKIYTAEYPSPNEFFQVIWRFLGISPSFKLKHMKLPMIYSSTLVDSFGNKNCEKIKKFEGKFASKNEGRVGFGLGTIAIGVLGNEPILSPEKLGEDLLWAKKAGIKEVFIFRLGGLNKEYICSIKSKAE